MKLPHFPHSYNGKEGFELFLSKHIQLNVSSESNRKSSFTRKDLQDNYINFCSVYGYNISSSIPMGKHLSFLGINKSYTGPRNYQITYYDNIVLSSNTSTDLLPHERQDPNSSYYTDLDNTDLTLSACQHPDDDAKSDASLSDDEDSSSGKEHQFNTEGEVAHRPTHDSRDVSLYTHQKKANVFDFIEFLEDFVESM